jgi:DNA-directed RNA polymerase specialized sigma24 family protein
MADDESFSPDRRAAYAPRRKWALTQQAFDKLLASLGEDRARAGERYLEVRSNLIRFFQWRGCPFPDDHADETINRVAKRIEEGEDIRNAPGYFLGVARMLVLEINRERAREHQALGEMASARVETSEPEEPQASIECLRACLESLSPENAELIVQYYQGEKSAKIENRKRLTERFKIPVNTLRMRALRLRDKLQVCVEDCLKR